MELLFIVEKYLEPGPFKPVDPGRPLRRPSGYINRQLRQPMLCSKILFTGTEISGGPQWAGKLAPNMTQEMGGQS